MFLKVQFIGHGTFNKLYKVVLTFKSEDEIPKRDHSTKATDQYFPVLLFVMLYKEVLTFEAANEILKCDHSNEQF